MFPFELMSNTSPLISSFINCVQHMDTADKRNVWKGQPCHSYVLYCVYGNLFLIKIYHTSLL